MRYISAFIIIFYLFLPICLAQSTASDSNVVALWHFDEGYGNVLHDASPYHNDGMIHNAEWVEGKIGQALYFNGTNSYVALPNSSSLKLRDEFTLEAWIKPDTLTFPVVTNGYVAVVLSNLGSYPYGGGYQMLLYSQGLRYEERTQGGQSHFSRYTPLPAPKVYYHIAYTYQRVQSSSNPNTTFTILKNYVDGILKDSISFSSPIQYDDTPNFYIGTNVDGRAIGGPGIREFLGSIDEIKISKVALTPDQFGSKYLIASPGAIDFKFVKVGEDSTLQLSLTNPSATDTIIIDSMMVTNTKFSVTGAVGQVLPQASLTFDVTYTPTEPKVDLGTLRLFTTNTDFAVTDISLTGKAFDETIDTNVVADWHFDEAAGRIVHDASLYSNDGTIYGNAEWVSGKKGSALHFDGSSSYVAVPNNESLKPNGDFTIEAWFKLDTLKFTNSDCYYCDDDRLAIISNLGSMLKTNSVNPSNYGGFELSVKQDSGLVFEYLGQQGNYGHGGYTGYSHVNNAKLFYHVAVVCKRNNSGIVEVTDISTYVNGTLTDMTTFTGIITFMDVPNLLIGTNLYSVYGYNSNYFRGTLDEMRISKIARDPSEFGLSGLTVTSNHLEMGDLKAGNSVSKDVIISNLSFIDSVTVNVQSDINPEYTMDTTPFTLEPRGEKFVTITYAPVDFSSDAGTFVFTTTDSLSSSVTVHAFGTGYVLLDAPRIKAVNDIPNDQGRQVRVIWYPSKYDAAGESLNVNEYSIWRKVDDIFDPKTAPHHATGEVFTVNGTKRTVLDGVLWDYVSVLPAVRFDYYSVVAPTIYNSTYWREHVTTFRVAAHTTTGDFFFSQPVGGHASDNIYPYAPENVYVITNINLIRLGWSAAPDPDLMEYHVYRSTESNFTITPSNELGLTTSTYYYDQEVETGKKYYYAVTSVDSSGNESVSPTYSVEVEVLDVNGDGSLIPVDYYLSNNYPNPFNPTTTLKFGLPERSNVTVTIINMLGQQVAELVNGVREAGTYEATWNAGVASGIYLYRINAVSVDNPNRTFIKTGKMLLLK